MPGEHERIGLLTAPHIQGCMHQKSMNGWLIDMDVDDGRRPVKPPKTREKICAQLYIARRFWQVQYNSRSEANCIGVLALQFASFWVLGPLFGSLPRAREKGKGTIALRCVSYLVWPAFLT